MRKISIQLLNFFFPLLCGVCGRADFYSYRVSVCGECIRKARAEHKRQRCAVCNCPLSEPASRCPYCDSRNVFFDRALSLYDRTDILSEILNKLKSKHEYPLSYFLSLGARKTLRGISHIGFEACCLLPSHKKHKISGADPRPFLPSYELYAIVDKILEIPLIAPLSKISSEKQAGKSYAERFFHAYKSWDIQEEWVGRCPSKILLLDDVFTTGASVNEASRILKRNGASTVYVLTYLRTLD